MVTNLGMSLFEPSAFHLVAKLQAKSDRELHMLKLPCLCQISLATKMALQAPHPPKILWIAAAYVVVQ